MPTKEEIEALAGLEEAIAPALEVEQNAIFLARITARGERILLYRVHDPEKANEALRLLISTPGTVREWEYQMEYDVGWMLAKPELDLLQPSRFN
ncbi:hypothetical protein D3C86_266470 [compost metagenome]